MKWKPDTTVEQAMNAVMQPKPSTPVAGDADLRGADALAYQCARLIIGGHLDSRSGVADALLNYLDVGGLSGPKDVPTWMKQYEAKQRPPQPTIEASTTPPP